MKVNELSTLDLIDTVEEMKELINMKVRSVDDVLKFVDKFKYNHENIQVVISLVRDFGEKVEKVKMVSSNES